MSRYDWNNPPPPGTDTEPSEKKVVSEPDDSDNELPPGFSEYKEIVARSPSPSPEPERRRRRHRSRSYQRRSRSYSRERRRRSRSRSRRRRRKHSSSRSRSRSPSYRHRHKHRRHSRSRSRGSKRRSHRSRSRSYRSRRSPKDDRRDRYSDKEIDEDVTQEEDMKIEDLEDEESDTESVSVPFKNDGSFLEMFKKMQEEKAKEEAPEVSTPKKPVLPTFGKRRGGKVLKTGLVAKVKNVEEEQGTVAQDAWSVYMKEVRKYKEVHCDDDSKTRPLVK